AQLAREAAARWYARYLQPLARVEPERALAFTTPVQARVLGSSRTVASLRASSLVPSVLTSAVLRRITRPGAPLMRTLPFDARRRRGNLLARVNAGEVSAAPPKRAPTGTPTVEH